MNAPRLSSLGAGLLILAATACGAADEPAAPPPRAAAAAPTPRPLATPDNLLLITLDTTRWDRLGCYGSERGATPTLDALAARGTRFDQAVAPVALTRPVHATILTGLLPHSHGVWSNGPYRLEPSHPSLGPLFAEAGASTGAVVASFVLSSTFGFARGFEHFDDRTHEIAGGDPEKPAEEVVERALSWLGHGLEPPFFLWVHFYDPHLPWEAKAPFSTRFQDPYDAEIAAMDAAIADLLEGLSARGWLDRTLVVAVADHGEGLGERNETSHGYLLYDNTLRVPLILAGPGVARGRVVAAQVTLADLAPTLAEAFALDLPGPLDGRSFWSELGAGAVSPRPAVVENRAVYDQYGWAAVSGLRSGGWKWLKAPTPELYDLTADPGERRNLAAAEPERAAELERHWLAVRPADAEVTTTVLSPEDQARLEALGYVAGGGATAPLAEGTDPKTVTAAIPLVEALTEARRRHDLSEVERLTAATLAIDPGNLFVRRVHGQGLVEQGRFAEALALLEPIAEGHDIHPETSAFVGMALAGLGRFDEALTWFERATSPPWIYWPSLVDLARLAANRPDLIAPREVLDRLAPLAPASARERLSVARAHALLGAYDRAEHWFEGALELEPGLTEARVGLAQMLIQLRRHDEALVELRQIRPETVESAYVLGATHQALGQGAEACDAFRRAVALEPRNPNLVFALATACERCALTTEAAALYRLFLTVAPPALAPQRAAAEAGLERMGR